MEYPHSELIKLIVAYSFVGAIVFTVIITCLSLIGLIKFAEKKQQNKLFYVLIVELVIISVGYFGDLLSFSSKEANEKVENYIESSVEEKVNERLSAQAFYGENFNWGQFDEFFNGIAKEFNLNRTQVETYKASALNQLMWRNEFKILYDEYTYHYELDRNDNDEDYTISVTGFSESNAVVDFLKEENVKPSRRLLNDIYDALNVYGYYSNNDLLPDQKLTIYRNEVLGLRFVKEAV